MTAPERRALALGSRSALILPAWIVGFSFLGVGSLARDIGHPLGATVLATVLIWAAPAQVILYSSLAAGAGLLTAALAVALSAIRLMPMTMSALPYLRRPGHGLLAQALIAHCVAATTWMEALLRLPEMEERERLPYFLGFAGSCLVVSISMTVAGYVLVGALPLPLAAGLLCLTPIYFTIALVASAKLASEWLAIAFGLGLAPLAEMTVGRDFDLLATGLVGGTLAYLVGRRLQRRAGRASP